MSTNNQFISVRETAQLLAISEKKVMELIEARQLQAYRIAEKFLRLKKTEVLNLKNSGDVKTENVAYEYSQSEKMRDFFYFNDFYIVGTVLIFILVYVIAYT